MKNYQVCKVIVIPYKEHSAILSTFIKLPFVIYIFILSIFEWLFYTGFTVLCRKDRQSGRQILLLGLTALETLVPELPGWSKISTLAHTFFIERFDLGTSPLNMSFLSKGQCRFMTDRQTDKETDRQTLLLHPTDLQILSVGELSSILTVNCLQNVCR